MGTEMGTEMKSSAERLEALAKEYPGYSMELLAHALDNDNLTVKYIPENIKVLFETPSGFAVFAIDSGYLYDIDIDFTGIQTIWVHCVNKDSADFFLWRKGFLKVDNKSTAIRPDGIDNSLAELIKKECGPGYILLVGESKYKEAIENNLGIPCRCDEAAEELMWGLQNLLYDLVPEEESEFGEQDCKYHSRKLLAYLHHINPDIKPDMIDGEMALLASIIHRCNVTNRNYRDNMHKLDKCLEKISGLKTDHWDTVTHATALMKLIGESVPTPKSMFTEDERKKMLEGVGKYGDEIDRATMRVIYKHTVQLNKLKFSKLHKLRSLLGEATSAAPEGARESEEAPQVSSSNRSGQEEEGAQGDDGQRKKLKADDGGSD